MAKKTTAWTNTLHAASNGQYSLFKSTDIEVGILQLKGTSRTVKAARQTQWSAYGLSVILDELKVNARPCTPQTMEDFDIVLYSVTAPVDQLSMVAELPIIDRTKKRRHKLIVGGQGSYPIWALKDIVDRVHFGRAEGVVNDVCLTDKQLPFVYDANNDPDIIRKYLIRASGGLQPLEDSVGCRQGCTFCQYTFTREIVGQKKNTSYSSGRQGVVMAEDTFATIDLSTSGRKMTALDGWSWETRKRVKKGITDKFFIKRLRKALETVEGTIIMKVFQIVGYPWETRASMNRDIERMAEILAEADGTVKTPARILIMFQNTPFSPEPLTPMEDDVADITIDWRDVLLQGGNSGRNVYKGLNIEAYIVPSISKPLTRLKRVAVNRGASVTQLLALNKCKTIEDGLIVVPDIWKEGAGLRASDYLMQGFNLPKYKNKLLGRLEPS